MLGNEGHGIRTNILRRCTYLVKIGGDKSSAAINNGVEAQSNHMDGSMSTAHGDEASESAAGVDAQEDSAVDSLNVSVTGAIILHHFLAAA